MANYYIGVLEHNKVRYITCGNDGNLSFVGVILQLGYTSIEKIKSLLNLGNIKYLGYNLDAPKKFKDGTEAERYYRSVVLHFKTTFTLAIVRDLHGIPIENKANVCSLEEFCAEASYGYYYDVKQNRWFVTKKSCKTYILERLLTDEAYFFKYRHDAPCCDDWNTVTLNYNNCKNDLICKGEYTIMSRYNAWLVGLSQGKELEFGYTVRDGKKVFAVMQKSKNGVGRRKVVKYSPYLGDLVQYVVLGCN